MLCQKALNSLQVRRISTFHLPLLQMRKNPTPVVHVVHDIHAVVQWVAPEKLMLWDPQRSCDLRPLPKIDPNWLKLEYRPFAEQIARLPEDHRKVFTVGLANRKAAISVIMENTMAKVRRHNYDTTSSEAIVARLTIRIRNLQAQMQDEKDRLVRANGLAKQTLKILIDKRKKHLTLLKNKDYKRFEWVIEILAVLYKPSPLKNIRIRRKECFTTLVDMYCEDVINKKMAVYKTELEGQKIPFLQEKLETLQKIKEDEDSMRIPCSVEEDIAETIKRLETLQKSTLDITPPPAQIPAA